MVYSIQGVCYFICKTEANKYLSRPSYVISSCELFDVLHFISLSHNLNRRFDQFYWISISKRYLISDCVVCVFSKENCLTRLNNVDVQYYCSRYGFYNTQQVHLWIHFQLGQTPQATLIITRYSCEVLNNAISGCPQQ